MQAEVAADRPRARPRPARAELHGRHRPDREQRDLHRRRVALAAARRASPGSPSPARSPTRSSIPATGSASRGSSAAAPRSSSTSATTWPTASTTPRRSSVILFVEGFKRPERFLALADRALELGKPIMAVKVGRSDQAQAAAIAHSGSLAGEARVTDAALDAAGVIRCRDLDELLETAELVEGVRRTGRRVGRGRTGVVTVSTGEASLIADLVPRTGARPAARARPRRGPRSSRRCRRWATSATRSTRGAPPTPATAYGAALRGDGRVGRLRRPRPRPRLPVPLAAVRGRDGQRGDRRAPRGDGRTAPRSCRSTCR